ncbi:hypothetical protein [Streptomyces sp. NPDC090021]
MRAGIRWAGLGAHADSPHTPRMIEETARHADHMDAIRELVDGGKGY